MFKKMKEDARYEAIFYERLRTFLYLSQYTNRRIWLVLLGEKQYFQDARFVDGVIETMFNYDISYMDPMLMTLNSPNFSKSETYYIKGGFSFINHEERYQLEEIYALSFQSIKNIQELDNTYVLNKSQHLAPRTGFNPRSNENELKYYKTIANLIN